jgi:hypothetical protein
MEAPPPSSSPSLKPPTSSVDDDDVETEVEYVFVSLEGVRPALSQPLAGAPLTVEGLHTAAPTLSVGNQVFRGRFREDLGSTLFFDRSSLKTIADAQTREARDLVLEETDEEPLVCVTTKRLCLHPAQQ